MKNFYINNLNTNITDIIWIQTGFIGDIIINTAAIELIHQKFKGQIKQHLITTPIGYEGLQFDHRLNSIIIFDKKKDNLLKTIYKIRKQLKSIIHSPKTTYILQPHRSIKSSLLSKFLGFYTITYYESALSYLSTIRVYRIALFHEAQRIALLTQPLGIDRQNIITAKPKLYIYETPEIRNKFNNIIKLKTNHMLVGIAPGSVWGTKQWPTEYYTELIQKILLTNNDVIIILLGSLKEQKEADYIINGINPKFYPRLINLIGKTSLLELRWIYPQLNMLVSNDSSPTHYASAFNIPNIVIFGSTLPSMGFAPLSDISKVIEIDLSCRPCGNHGYKQCPLKHFKCMRNLSVDFVFQEVQNMLKIIT